MGYLGVFWNSTDPVSQGLGSKLTLPHGPMHLQSTHQHSKMAQTINDDRDYNAWRISRFIKLGRC